MNDAPSAMVSPGLWGFVAFFVLAIALYLLMRNMNARMRRMSYRSEELAREAQAEADERKARKAGDVPTGDVPEDPEQTGETKP
ncbi:MAG: hypothetical protein ABIO48_00395 [Pedococcus sp.]